MRILFICHKNDMYGWYSYSRRSSGLFNSTSFIVKGLIAQGIHAAIIEVTDNNDIDREITKFKPDVVVIEALWVVPEKFDVLKRLHRDVTWYIHLHSQVPFLALEGIATSWIPDCAKRGVNFICNSPESFDAVKVMLDREQVRYLPNVYIHELTPFEPRDEDKSWIDIGCFGAVRPFKNQLLQALAAIRFAREKGKYLRFHINASRVETGGNPVLKNLIQLFNRTGDADLIQAPWFDPVEFLNYLRGIDLGMQVSLTETFNVVCADYATAGIPMVASKEVPWITGWTIADAADINSMVRVMHRVWNRGFFVSWNQRNLRRYSFQAQDAWYRFCRLHR